MKGLSQIEALIQLEEATGRKTTELFDWIVGTSTGGIIALALVYGECYVIPPSDHTHKNFHLTVEQFVGFREHQSIKRVYLCLTTLSLYLLSPTAKLPLSQVRQLYFRLKNKVFAKARFGVVYSADELEKILREVFGDMTMDQVLQPKYGTLLQTHHPHTCYTNLYKAKISNV